MELKRIGIAAAAVGVTGLGLVEVAFGAPLPGLHALPEGAPAWIATGAGILLMASAVSMMVSRLGAALASLVWLVACVLAFGNAIGSGDVLAWVPVAETAVLAVFALWRRDEARGWLAMRLTFGAMLVLFGAIHVLHRDMITTLIPEWIPRATYWPWFTGGLSFIAGAACLIGGRAALGAGAIGVMYLSWLPIVHAPRLLAAPDSLFEWTFALTALALAGVAFAIAGESLKHR